MKETACGRKPPRWLIPISKFPWRAAWESLNAAMASGILMYGRQGSAAEDENNAAGKRTEGGSNQGRSEYDNRDSSDLEIWPGPSSAACWTKGYRKAGGTSAAVRKRKLPEKMEDSCKIRTASSNREVAEEAEMLVLAVKASVLKKSLKK